MIIGLILILCSLFGVLIAFIKAKRDKQENVSYSFDYLDYIIYFCIGFMMGFVLGLIIVMILMSFFIKY